MDAVPENDPEVIGLLGKYGLKVELKAKTGADAGAAAGQGTPNNEEAALKPLAEKILKEIDSDGTLPPEQKLSKVVAMAAASQQQIGKLGQELGPLRVLRDGVTEKGWFTGIEKGQVVPNLIPLADALTPEEFTRQIQSEEAQQKLASSGFRIVPITEGNDLMDQIEQAVAADLVKDPKVKTHEDRMDLIREDTELQRKFNREVTTRQVRAEASAGAKKLQSQAQLEAARQEVSAVLADLQQNQPDLWKLIGPQTFLEGKKLPASMPHMEGLQFALGRAFYENREAIIRDAINLGFKLGRKTGQGDSQLVIGPGGGGGGGAAAGSQGTDSDEGAMTAEDRRRAGLPVR